MRGVCVSFCASLSWQAADFLHACGVIVCVLGETPHAGEWKFEDFAGGVADFSLFLDMLELKFGGKELPVDVRHLYDVLDGAKDKSTVQFTLQKTTVAKVLKADLVPRELMRTKRDVLSHFDWGTLLALIAAAVDERFGWDTFPAHPTRDAAARAGLQYLMANRHDIEVRPHRLLCTRRGGVGCLPALRICARLSGRPPARAAAPVRRAVSVLQRVMSGEDTDDRSGDVGGAVNAEVVVVAGSESSSSHAEARAAACSRVWAAFACAACPPGEHVGVEGEEEGDPDGPFWEGRLVDSPVG